MTPELQELVERAEKAQGAAKRLIDSHFNNEGELPRIQIPARPDEDDDLVLTQFIKDAKSELTRLAEELEAAKAEITNLRDAPYAPWGERDPDDTVGAMIDNQAWVLASHLLSRIGERDGFPTMMEEFQDEWAENSDAMLKGWFSPHRAMAFYLSQLLTVNPKALNEKGTGQ